MDYKCFTKSVKEGAYYNRTSGDCPYGANGATTPCDFSESGLTKITKKMISKSKWYLGGIIGSTGYNSSEFYSSETGSLVYSGNSSTWFGNVGLMYPSDYGYATAGGETMDRSTCLNTRTNKWTDDCKNNDWLKLNDYFKWTITHHRGSAYNVVQIAFSSYSAKDTEAVYPVVYIDPQINVNIKTNGSADNPFILR